nr:lipopolysaccharide biosynthesis protein [uncultured Bacteroides sp.]
MQSTKKQLLSGIFYSAISKYTGMGISLIVAGILARIISPEDFGVVAIATVIITFFSIFSDLGIAPAIIQNKELTSRDLSNIFSFTIWTGIVISTFFFLTSWSIAKYYNNHLLLSICQWLSIDLFFASANIVPNALLFKNKLFKFIAIRSLIIQLAGGILAISAALMGAGLYALIINPIFSGILIFVVSYKKYPQKIKFNLGIISMKKIFSFTFYQFLFNVINYFSRNLDKLLIGKYMGMSPLGYYEKSYRLMMLPLQNITHVISPVMHPIFSEYQNNYKQLQISYEKVIRILAFIGFPLSIFLYFTAREITLLIFGSQWIPSIHIFQILSLSVGIQIILSTSGSIFQAANATKTMFISGLISTILNTSGILIGIFLFKDLKAVAWGICISFTINFIQCYFLMYKATFKLPFYSFYKLFFSPLLLSGIIYLFLYEVTNIIICNIFISLIIKSSLFVIIGGLYIQWTNEYNIYRIIYRLIKRQ